jgi:molecular chaperone DnaK
MTVTGGSALPKEDIDRMMREAEQYAEEDRKRREAAETRNQAEQLVYQTEKFLHDNEDRVPADTRSEVEEAIGELKTRLEQNADTAALRNGVEKLATVSQKMGQAMYESASAAGGTATEQTAAPEEEGVVDAEIVDDDRDTKGGAA